MSDWRERDNIRRMAAAFREAERRARHRGLTRDDIEREQGEDDSQFWVDVWKIHTDPKRLTDDRSL